MSSTHPLSRFHCMLSTVFRKASSKHMYWVDFGGVVRCLTIAGVSCTTIDCCRFTMGELVGNVPHLTWSPNMLPKQLARGAPLSAQCVRCFCSISRFGARLPEEPDSFRRVHVGHHPVHVPRRVRAQVVHRHLVWGRPHDVMLQRVRSKNRHLARAVRLDILHIQPVY